MALDTPGAMLISGAALLLFRTLVLTFLKHRAVDEARTQHYTDAAHERRSWSAGAQKSIQGALDAMPPRMRIGLAMGLAGALVPFALRKLSQLAKLKRAAWRT